MLDYTIAWSRSQCFSMLQHPALLVAHRVMLTSESAVYQTLILADDSLLHCPALGSTYSTE